MIYLQHVTVAIQLASSIFNAGFLFLHQLSFEYSKDKTSVTCIKVTGYYVSSNSAIHVVLEHL